MSTRTSGTETDPATTRRRAEIERNLAAVRARIAEACTSVGRSPDEVTLTVVTKFFPASDVRLLAGLGVTDVGENRHQEAEVKAAETRDLGLRWHFIGTLQSNKAAAVARYADVVESVDRAKLLTGLARGAAERGAELDCLVQVSLDPPGAGEGGIRRVSGGRVGALRAQVSGERFSPAPRPWGAGAPGRSGASPARRPAPSDRCRSRRGCRRTRRGRRRGRPTAR